MFQPFNNKGITLVEIIVSLAILGVIVVPLSTLFVNSVKNNVKAEDRLIASQLAQEKMEALMHQETLLPDVETVTEGAFNITYEITNYDDTGVAATTGSLISDYDTAVSFDGAAGAIDLSSEDSPIYIQVESNTITFNRTSETEGQIAIEHFTGTEDVKIKVHCDNTEKDMTINVYNRTDIPVKIYKVSKTSEPTHDVVVRTEYGRVYTYQQIYETEDASEKKYRIYKIAITVSKDGKELANIASLRTMD